MARGFSVAGQLLPAESRFVNLVPGQHPCLEFWQSNFVVVRTFAPTIVAVVVTGQFLPVASRFNILVPGQHPCRAVLGHIVSARAILAHMPNKKMHAREPVKFMICKRANETELLEMCPTTSFPPSFIFTYLLCPMSPYFKFADNHAVWLFDMTISLAWQIYLVCLHSTLYQIHWICIVAKHSKQ